VDGVLTADPRRVPLCQVLSEVSYNEAMELAYFGAKVVHGKTMQPAITSTPQIPIYIRNTFKAHLPGTRIFTTSTTHNSEKVVCGFSSVENIALINVEGSGLIGVPGLARRLFGTLEQHKVNVILISQASSEHTVTFACTMLQADLAKQVLEEEFEKELSLGRISSVDVQAPASIIAAVGDGMFHTTGVSGRFFSALGDAKINVLAVAQGCSERNISAVVKMEDSTRALRAVHAAFRLSHTTIRVAIVGMNDLGHSLLKLLDNQRAFLKKNFGLDLQVCVILPNTDERDLIVLKNNLSDSDDSIDYATIQARLGDMAVKARGGLEAVLTHLFREEATNHVLFDCTNDEEAGRFHSYWLKAGIDVVTANNTGLSGPKAQRHEIRKAEKVLGKKSAEYMREVTVGGGLPVISTMRQLLNSGDRIRRIDGIFSTSLSYIMFRVSPPPHYTLTGTFDEELTQGRYFHGSHKLDVPCSFSQAIKEAIELGLMEEDPTKDLNNEYTARILMVVACELGLDDDWETEKIHNSSDKIVETILHSDGKILNYLDLPPALDEKMKARVDSARAKGNVLRHISSVDVKTKQVTIQLMEVPEHHVFACTPPSCEIVRFFTQRHKTYPLVVQGPSAGADSTASALVAELLNAMRGKVNPRSVALSRSGSYMALKHGLLPSPQPSSSNLQHA
jgi:aspartokinase/homoserine dehydrogenase 1